MSSRAPNGFVNVAASGVTPDVHTLGPMGSCAAYNENSADLAADRGKFLASDAVPDPTELSQ